MPAVTIDPLTDVPLTSPHGKLLSAEYLQLIVFVILVYDHFLTFSDEVKYIWKQRFSGIAYLFLLNRYLTEIRYFMILDTFQNPSWTILGCRFYAIFQGIVMIFLYGVAELIMILRVYALYHRSRSVLFLLMLLWTAQMVVSGLGSAGGDIVPETYTGGGGGGDSGVQCLFSETDPVFAVMWITPLLTDTILFILTIWKTRAYILWCSRNEKAKDSPIMHALGRDGILYYAVVFSSNWLNLFLYLAKADDLKVISVSITQVVTSTMVSRLVLALRDEAAGEVNVDSSTKGDGDGRWVSGQEWEGRQGQGNGRELDTFCAVGNSVGESVSVGERRSVVSEIVSEA